MDEPVLPDLAEKTKTYMAFDFGLRRIGVAIGQTLTRSARPLHYIKARGGTPDWPSLDKQLFDWEPDGLIVGMPRRMDGSLQPIGEQAQAFADSLRERFKLPVHLCDERLTTVEARARLFAEGGYKALKKGTIDSVAAQVILEAWLQEMR